MIAPDDARIAEATRLLELSEDALFEDIARADENYAFIDDALDYGKRRYRIIKTNLKSNICENDIVRQVFTDGSTNRRYMLVIAVADLIYTKGAMSIAAQLVREGLDIYCTNEWHVDGNA
jgi:hypothetical protein